MSTPNSAATPAPGTPDNPTPEQCQAIFKAKYTVCSKASTPEEKTAARATLAAATLAGGKLKAFASGAGQSVGSITFSGFTYGITAIDGPKVSCQTLPTTNMETEPSTNGSINESHIPSAYVKGDDLTVTTQEDPTIVAPVGTQDNLTLICGPLATSKSGTCTLKSYTPHRPLDGSVMTGTAVFEHSGPFA